MKNIVCKCLERFRSYSIVSMLGGGKFTRPLSVAGACRPNSVAGLRAKLDNVIIHEQTFSLSVKLRLDRLKRRLYIPAETCCQPRRMCLRLFSSVERREVDIRSGCRSVSVRHRFRCRLLLCSPLCEYRVLNADPVTELKSKSYCMPILLPYNRRLCNGL